MKIYNHVPQIIYANFIGIAYANEAHSFAKHR